MFNFKNKLSLILIVSISFSMMYTFETQAGTSGDDAEIIFYRNSFVGKLIKSTIYEVTDNETKFIGILANKTKISYKTKPGKHVFMVVSEAADFMEAEVVAGKTYYSVITPRMGAWKARFSMYPVKTDGTTEHNTESKAFKKAMKKVKPPKNPEKALKWYEKHKESVEEKRAKYWAAWQEKSAEDRAIRTLKLGDGE